MIIGMKPLNTKVQRGQMLQSFFIRFYNNSNELYIIAQNITIDLSSCTHLFF